MPTKAQIAERAEFIEKLREIVPPGTKVYTSLTHVSASGMSRSIKVYIMTGGEPHEITYWVAKALDYRINDRRGGVKIGGCGMDMGFHLVNSMSYALHGMQSVGKDAQASEGRPFTPTAKQYRAGYSLIHVWL